MTKCVSRLGNREAGGTGIPEVRGRAGWIRSLTNCIDDQVKGYQMWVWVVGHVKDGFEMGWCD